MSLRRSLFLAAITCTSILGFAFTVAIDPAVILAKQADYHLGRKEYGKAIELFNESLAVKPDQPEVRQRLVDLYILKKKPAAAKAILDPWLTARPDDPQPHASLGTIMESLGKPDEAMEQYRKTLDLDPRQREARHRLAYLHLSQGRLDPARTEIETLLGEDSTDQDAHFKLGQILAAQDLPQAMAHLVQAVDLGTDTVITAQAEEILETVLAGQAEGNRAHAAAALGRTFLKTREIILARRQFEEATRLDGRYADAFAYLGYTWLLLQRPDLAEENLLKAVELDPASPFGRHILGDALRTLGKVQQAIEEMNKAAELDPDDPYLLSDLALVYLAADDISAAEEHYVRAATLARTDPAFAGQLAHFYLDRMFKVQDGLAAARHLVELEPGNGEYLDLLGWAFNLNGQTGDAEKTLNDALKQTPYLASARYHLAVLHEQSGQIDKARQSYERAADLDLSGAIEKRANLALAQIAANAALAR